MSAWSVRRFRRAQKVRGQFEVLPEHRANVEDLTHKREHLIPLVRGKTCNRIAYLRADNATHIKDYLALRRGG